MQGHYCLLPHHYWVCGYSTPLTHQISTSPLDKYTPYTHHAFLMGIIHPMWIDKGGYPINWVQIPISILELCFSLGCLFISYLDRSTMILSSGHLRCTLISYYMRPASSIIVKATKGAWDLNSTRTNVIRVNFFP